jgi:hypothetical protein
MAMKMWVVIFSVVLMSSFQDGSQCFEGKILTSYKTSQHHRGEDHNPYVEMFLACMCKYMHIPSPN